MRGLRGIWLILLMWIVCPARSVAQQSASEVSQCMQAGNAACLTSHIGNAITLTMGGDRSTYSRAQAEMVLRDFFHKHSPRSFKPIPSGDNRINGVLSTEKGTYNVFISISATKGGYQVQEIRLEQ